MDVITAFHPELKSEPASTVLGFQNTVRVEDLFCKSGVLKRTLGEAHKGWAAKNTQDCIAALEKILKKNRKKTITLELSRRTGLDFISFVNV